MVITLYHVPASGPCRTVRLVAAAIGVKLDLKYIDVFGKEQYSPEFLKMNPQHTVPTIDDNGFYLGESRAISTYLIEKYAKNDSLYPKDPKQRAIINQRLYFDFGSLYQPYVDYYIMILFTGAPADPKYLAKINEAFEILDGFLEDETYVAGKNLTVADIALLTTISNYPIVDYDMSKFKNVNRWFENLKKEIPQYDEINEEGLKEYRILMNQLMKK